MLSAFGVEHGEISKARGRRARKRAAANPALAAQRAANEQKLRAVGRGIKGAPGKVVTTKVSIADVGRTAGGAVTGAGRLAGKAPGLTGIAVLGSGGYALHRHTTKPKKRPVVQ